MKSIEKTIEVDAPLSAVYNQWTQFEEFPQFMEGVKEVQQIDDKRLHWVAEIGGKRKEWDAEIFEQVPDSTIAWRSMSGVRNSGQVSFLPMGNYATKVCLKLHYDPEGTLENVADALGVLGRRVEGDLERFKKFIQARRHETGSWRGEILPGEQGMDAILQPRPPAHQPGAPPQPQPPLPRGRIGHPDGWNQVHPAQLR